MKKTHIDYFPIMRALSLKDGADEQKQQLDELKALLESIHEQFGSLEEFVRNCQAYAGLVTHPPPTGDGN